MCSLVRLRALAAARGTLPVARRRAAISDVAADSLTTALGRWKFDGTLDEIADGLNAVDRPTPTDYPEAYPQRIVLQEKFLQDFAQRLMERNQQALPEDVDCEPSEYFAPVLREGVLQHRMVPWTVLADPDGRYAVHVRNSPPPPPHVERFRPRTRTHVDLYVHPGVCTCASV